MISVCIPIYNFDVNCLVNQLSNAILKVNVSVEIILIDDCSNSEFKEKNQKSCSNYTYIELNENIGRAKIRNLFLDYVQFDYLLFLDCDSLIINENFIQNYIDVLSLNSFSVICGGREYTKEKTNRKKILSWKYGSKIESKNVVERKKKPHKTFMTNNFIIKKHDFEQIKFNEFITNYGHEDTLFGFELMKQNKKINHIDNPILNGDIEENEIFLLKTEDALKNLILIEKIILNQEFNQFVSILKFYDKNKIYTNLFYFIYKLFGKTIRLILSKGFVNLKLFNFYKLAYFVNLKKN
jgi:hypothetical protein